MTSEARTEVVVVGGGPAGLIAALALSRNGVRTTLLAPRPAHADRRTTALLGASLDVLKDIGVWESIAAKAAPLRKLRLVDGTRRLIRTPEALFDSKELGLETFGFNVENEHLLAALHERITRSEIQVVEELASRIDLSADDARVTLANGQTLIAKLIVAADGRNSLCRAAVQIPMTRRPLSQFAVALNLTHSRLHHDVSTEFHTASGPFTLVPLQGLRSSLVWVCTEADANRIRGASDDALSREIETSSHHILGEVQVDGPRGIFPLGVELADRFADRRVTLVGESGHVIPPIGAQGLNLGIRDAASIARLAGEALQAGGDPGAEAVMQAYDAERRADVRSRAAAVEMLGRSLLSSFLPVHLARGIGLEIASRIPFLRRNLMRAGLGIGSSRSGFA